MGIVLYSYSSEGLQIFPEFGPGLSQPATDENVWGITSLFILNTIPIGDVTG